MLPKYGKPIKLNEKGQNIIETETKILKEKLNSCTKNSESTGDRDISNLKLEIRRIAQIHKYNSNNKLCLTILRMRHLFVNVVEFMPDNKFKILVAAAQFINIRKKDLEFKKEFTNYISNVPTPIESPQDNFNITKLTQSKSHLIEKYLITVDKYNVENLKIDLNELVEI